MTRPARSPARPGTPSALGRPHADGTRLAQFKARCRGCPLRERCTTSKTGRVLSVHPQHALLAAARRAAADPAWRAEYRRWRPPVERAIAWLAAHGNRRVPYRGITKNNTWLHHRAAALNLRRLVNLGLTHSQRRHLDTRIAPSPACPDPGLPDHPVPGRERQQDFQRTF